MPYDINSQITQRFEQNVTFLQLNHRIIYEKLLVYEKELNENKRRQRFTLAYENGQFDIVELHSNKHLYNKQSNHFIDTIAQSINCKRNENVFESFKLVTPSPRLKGYDFAYKLFEQYSGSHTTMQTIHKFIFFGSGLHLEAVANKLKANYYLIVEDDIELFRLSLFTTPYFEIAQESELFFAVSSSDQEFEKIGTKFLSHAHYYNHYIKFFDSIFHTDEKLRQLHTLIVSQPHLNYFYPSIVEQYTQPLHYLFEGYRFLNLTAQGLQERFQNHTAILVAPGPSLDENIEFLQTNTPHCLVIALSATLPRLEKAGITPDIVTHFDGFERSLLHFEQLQDPSFLHNTIALLSAKTPHKVTEYFPKEQIFFFENGTNYKQGFGEMHAFCAGSSTFMITVAFGFKEIYLLGLDLALNQTTLATHNNDYGYTLEAQQHEDTLSFRDSIIEVEGNFKPKVKSTPNFARSIKAINEIATALKHPYQSIFNLNNGAKFANTTAIHPQKLVQCQDQKLPRNTLLALLQTHSDNQLTQQETTFLKEIYDTTHHTLQKVRQFANTHFEDAVTFLEGLKQFENDICFCETKSCAVIALLMENYMHFVLPYIFDAFNSELTPDIANVQQDVTNNLAAILEDFAQPFQHKASNEQHKRNDS